METADERAARRVVVLPDFRRPRGKKSRRMDASTARCSWAATASSPRPTPPPSSRNNVLRMADALSGGMLNMQTIVTREDGLSSASALVALIRETFADADADDVSYFYISTHGLWNTAVNGLMTLLLSDGESEEGITAYELRRVFDTIPGKKGAAAGRMPLRRNDWQRCGEVVREPVCGR